MATDKRQQIRDAFDAYVSEAEKFWDKGNASAGTRARKHLMEIRNLAKAERDAISEQKKDGK